MELCNYTYFINGAIQYILVAATTTLVFLLLDYNISTRRSAINNGTTNTFVAAFLSRAQAEAEIGSNNAVETESRTELDSHANMVVAGWNAFILN